jgi:hypothetical protein
MKKITLLLTMLLIGFTSHAQFPENFDGGVIPAGWTTFSGENGIGTAQFWDIAGVTNPYMIVADEDAGAVTQDWLVSPLTSITNVNSMLTFYEQTLYLSPYEPTTLSIRISTTSQTDIGSFTTVSSLTATQVFDGNNSRSVDLAAYESNSVYIAWVQEQNWGDGWIIDDLDLVNQYVSAPTPATTPNPADGSTVSLNNETDTGYTFTWSPGETGDAPTTYDFFLGTSADGVEDSYSTETSFNDGFTLNGLSTGTTFFWKIVPKNIGGSAENCPVWSFTTSDTFSTEDIQLSAIMVSPNPVKDVITINSPVGFDSVKVFNQLGQLVLKSNANLMNNNRLDLSALNPGMYMLQIEAENKSKTVKIIKE